MLTRIALKNFMSHVETSFELGPGLNVITGPNNCGKSAIVAAVQLVCRNHLTGDVVARHGTKECAVTLWTDDGHEITWRRKGKDVSYVIDGTEYSRLKGKVPEILHTILKLPEIEEGDEAFDLHFGLQKEPIFLLDEAGSKAAKFFASSSDAARLMEMQQVHKSRSRDRKASLKHLSQEADELDHQLKALEPVPALRERTDAVIVSYQELQKQVELTDALAYVCQQIIDQQANIAQEGNVVAVMNRLPAWPSFIDTEPLEEWLAEHHELNKQRNLHEQRLAQLEKLIPPPELSDVRQLSIQVELLQKLERQFQRETAERNLLNQLSPVPEMVTDSKLQDFLTQWNRLRVQHERDENDVTEIERACDALTQDITRFADQYPQCPTCRQPWHAEELVAGGHEHA
jgi:hypothetical protein